MRRSLLIVALLLAIPCAHAGDVYRWADANGAVHFSDTPPPNGVKFKIMDMQTGVSHDPVPPEPISDIDTAATSDATSNTNKPATMQDTPANRAKLCSSLQSKIDVLSSDQPLVDGDTAQPLTAADRSSRIAAAQAQQKEYCAP